MALLRRFNPSIHHRRSIRLKGYDYSSPGYYFITFCTINRERLFGEIENGIMKLNPFGKVVEFTWMDLPNHNPSISLDAFVVMPDHVHGIIIIKNVNKIDTIDEGDDDSVGAGSEPTPTRMIRQIKNEKRFHALPEIIRQLKTFSARRINETRSSPGKPVWQRDYNERIIRNGKELDRIRKYIHDNPSDFC